MVSKIDLSEKKILLFNVGYWKESIYSYTVRILQEEGMEILGVFDNDNAKQGRRCPLDKYVIENPEELENRYKEANAGQGCFVIITDVAERDTIEKQMKCYGLERGRDWEYIFCLNELFNANKYAQFVYECKKEGIYYPNSARLELSSYCNLKCIYCGYHSAEFDSLPQGCNKNLEFDTLKVIVDQLNQIPSICIVRNVQKGEMFCNPIWYEMVSFMATELKWVELFHFSTNGILLSKENVDKLMTLKFKKISITISLDGYDGHENDRLRIGSDYNRIRENILYLLSRKDDRIFVRIESAKILNARDLELFKKGLRLDGKDYLHADYGEQVEYWRVPALAGNQEINQKICEQEGAYVETISQHNYIGCPLPFTEIAIDSEGFVCICGCNPAGNLYRVGNVLKENMLEIWNKKIFNTIREQYADGKTVKLCNRCISNGCENETSVFVKYIQ